MNQILVKRFEKIAIKNIKKDLDIAEETQDFLEVISEYGDYLVFRNAKNEEEIEQSTNLVRDLFIFLFPTVGGSRSDYLASAIANAIEESNIVIDFKVESKKMKSECCKKLYRAINSKAVYPFQAMNRMKKYNLFA